MKKLLGDPGKAKRTRFLMTADKVAGDIVVENGLVGFLIDDAADTTEGVGYYGTDEKGAGPFPKTAPEAIDRYDVAYWDTNTGKFTAVATGNTIKVGMFGVAGGSADTTITGVIFDGQPDLDIS